MNLNTLDNLLSAEPKFRVVQARRAVLHDFVSSWNEVANLPKALRERLEQEWSLSIKGETFMSGAKNTRRALITLSDGLRVETVLMSHQDGRRTICLSSQVGCPLACRFCATGALGFKRNLTYSEIITQALWFARELKKKGERISNVVFMGMGEPLLNYVELMKAIEILNSPAAFNIGARQISISSVGIIPGLEKLSREKRQINLAISLHAASDEKRAKLMPVDKQYPLPKLMVAVDKYIAKTRRRVMLEYLLLSGVNDSPEDAQSLAVLAKRSLVFVNLIKYNETGKFKPSSNKAAADFKKILEDNGIPTTSRYRFGDDIKAACGQLAGGGRK